MSKTRSRINSLVKVDGGRVIVGTLKEHLLFSSEEEAAIAAEVIKHAMLDYGEMLLDPMIEALDGDGDKI